MNKVQDAASYHMYRTAPSGKPVHKAWAGNKYYANNEVNDMRPFLIMMLARVLAPTVDGFP